MNEHTTLTNIRRLTLGLTTMDIEPIGYKTLENPVYKNVELLSLPEYEIITKKLLFSITDSSVANYVLQNDDIFANLVHKVMMADVKFNGTGNLGGYRSQCLSWAFASVKRRYLERQKRERHNKSLDRERIGIQEGGSANPRHILLDKNAVCANTYIEAESKQEVSKRIQSAIENSGLNNNQKMFIRGYYFEGKSVRKLADSSKLSMAAVYQNLEKALEKVKFQLINDDVVMAEVN